MPFVTTCPHCKTSFRVDPDQIERGRGRVRCGVCKRVFPGAEQLRHLADPAAAAPSQFPDQSSISAAGPQQADEAPVVGKEAAPGLRPTPGAPLFPAPRQGEWDPLQAVAHSDGGAGRHETPITTHDVADPARHTEVDPIAIPERSPGRPLRTGEAQAGVDERHTIFTQTSPRWQESGVLPGRGDGDESRSSKPWHTYAVIVLLLLAALQLMLLFRSELVARVPALRPVADVVAGAFGMSVEGIRSIASLSIESTELQRAGGNGQAALHALLRNKDARTVRWPALELTLTDQAGAVLLRKVLLPADYLPAGAPRDGLRARSEWPIRLGLDLGSLPLANYSVDLFYP